MNIADLSTMNQWIILLILAGVISFGIGRLIQWDARRMQRRWTLFRRLYLPHMTNREAMDYVMINRVRW